MKLLKILSYICQKKIFFCKTKPNYVKIEPIYSFLGTESTRIRYLSKPNLIVIQTPILIDTRTKNPNA